MTKKVIKIHIITWVIRDKCLSIGTRVVIAFMQMLAGTHVHLNNQPHGKNPPGLTLTFAGFGR